LQYFRPIPPPSDGAIFSAWDSEVARAAGDPWLEKILGERRDELKAGFAECYCQLRALPRGSRHAVQRRLAESRDIALAPERRRRLAYSLAGAALLLALAQEVGAGTINVTTKNPAVSDGDGSCSLSEAIINANNHATTHVDCPGAGPGPNTINLPKGIQTVTQPFGDCHGDTGLPPITSTITIEGNGAKLLRQKNAPHFRFFCVQFFGDLTLNDVTLRGGYSYSGGAIWNNGHLTINNSVISGNVATDDGGAIDNYETTFHIANSTLSKNKANHGGAISNYASRGHVEHSIITGNIADVGGAIHNYGTTITIDNGSVISRNTATRLGGGIAGYGGRVTNYYYDNYGNRTGSAVISNTNIVIINTTISTNYAADNGGGIYTYGSDLNITGSSIIKRNFSGRIGGGVYTRENIHFYVTDTLVSGNKAIFEGGGVAAIFTYYLPDVATGDTFLKNKSTADSTTNDTYIK
jgi:hypothetical protein